MAWHASQVISTLLRIKQWLVNTVIINFETSLYLTCLMKKYTHSKVDLLLLYEILQPEQTKQMAFLSNGLSSSERFSQIQNRML